MLNVPAAPLKSALLIGFGNCDKLEMVVIVYEVSLLLPNYWLSFSILLPLASKVLGVPNVRGPNSFLSFKNQVWYNTYITSLVLLFLF